MRLKLAPSIIILPSLARLIRLRYELGIDHLRLEHQQAVIASSKHGALVAQMMRAEGVVLKLFAALHELFQSLVV
jgi:hypothetical protein